MAFFSAVSFVSEFGEAVYFVGCPILVSAVGVFVARFVWVVVPWAIWFVRVYGMCVTC